MFLYQTKAFNLFPKLNSFKFAATGHRTRRYLALFLSPSIRHIHLNLDVGRFDLKTAGLDYSKLETVTLHKGVNRAFPLYAFIDNLNMAPRLTQLHLSQLQSLTVSQLRTALTLPSLRSLGFCLERRLCLHSSMLDVVPAQGLRVVELFLSCITKLDLPTLALFLQMIGPTSKQLRHLHLFVPHSLSRRNFTPTCNAVRTFTQLTSLSIRRETVYPNITDTATDEAWPLSELPLKHLGALGALTRLNIHALPILATSEFVNIASKQWPNLTHLSLTEPLQRFEVPVLMTVPYQFPHLVSVFTPFTTPFPGCRTHIRQPALSSVPITRTITLQDCECRNPFSIVLFIRTYIPNVRLIGHGFLGEAMAWLDDNNTSISSNLYDYPSLIDYPFLVNPWFELYGAQPPSTSADEPHTPLNGIEVSDLEGTFDPEDAYDSEATKDDGHVEQ